MPNQALRNRWQVCRHPGGSKGAMVTSPNLGHFSGTPVYLGVKDGMVDAKMVDADLHDDLFRESKGTKPELLELEVCCPRCGEWNRIPGTKKTIRVGYFNKPRPLMHLHDATPVWQCAMVTIEEPLQCSHEIGKTICGYTFRITENVIHRA